MTKHFQHRIIASLLILVVAFQLIGTRLVYEIQKEEIKEQVIQQIANGVDESELTKLIFSSKSELNTELNWENEREFKYDGQRYDVINIRASDDLISVWCILDDMEEALEERFEDAIDLECHNDFRKSQRSKFNELLGATYILQTCEFTRNCIAKSFNYLTKTYPTFDAAIDTSSPPPDFV